MPKSKLNEKMTRIFLRFRIQLRKLAQFMLITNWLNVFSAKLTTDPELPFIVDHSRSLCVQRAYREQNNSLMKSSSIQIVPQELE